MAPNIIAIIATIFLIGLLLTWLKAKESNRGSQTPTSQDIVKTENLDNIQQPDDTATTPTMPTAKAVGFKKGQTHPTKDKNTPKQKSAKLLKPPPSEKAKLRKAGNLEKRPRKAAIELLEYGIKVAAAFVALSTTFALNSWRTQQDRKERLIALLSRLQENEIIYRTHLDEIARTAQQLGSMGRTAVDESLHNLTYPYYSDLKDQALWDVSVLSVPVFDNSDYQVKVTLKDTLSDRNEYGIFQTIETYINSSIKQVELEIKFQKDNDSAAMQKETNKNYMSQTLRAHRI
jgi:hypothetical protein